MRTRRGNTRAEKSSNIVISDEQAKAIKETYETGSTTLARLAKEYHVSRSCIHYIVKPELFNNKRRRSSIKDTEDMSKNNNEKRDIMIKLAQAGKMENSLRNILKDLHVQYLEKILEARIVMRDRGIVALNKWLDREPSFVENDLNLSTIGYIMGITRERVRQIETSALKKLKHPRVNRDLRHYNNISKPLSY